MAKFNGRHEEGEKININVRERGTQSVCVYNCVYNQFEQRKLSSFCIDAAGVHAERDVLCAGLLLDSGSVPHPHDEEHDNLPQCCLVRVEEKLNDSFYASSMKLQ